MAPYGRRPKVTSRTKAEIIGEFSIAQIAPPSRSTLLTRHARTPSALERSLERQADRKGTVRHAASVA